MSNYPPGVTGNEYEIAGWPTCGNCGHEAEEHDNFSEECEYISYGCPCEGYSDQRPEPDPDESRDREFDRKYDRIHE